MSKIGRLGLWLAPLLALAAIIPAAGQISKSQNGHPFPQFDIPASCSGNPNPPMCVQWERNARNELAGMWNSLPPAKQLECARNPRNSYMTARECARR